MSMNVGYLDMVSILNGYGSVVSIVGIVVGGIMKKRKLEED